jgi:hypothetical protein
MNRNIGKVCELVQNVEKIMPNFNCWIWIWIRIPNPDPDPGGNGRAEVHWHRLLNNLHYFQVTGANVVKVQLQNFYNKKVSTAKKKGDEQRRLAR